MATTKKKTSPSKNTRTSSAASKKSTSNKTTSKSTSSSKTTAKKSTATKKTPKLHPQVRSALNLLIALAVIIAVFPAIQFAIDYQSARQHLKHLQEIPLPTAFEENTADALLYDTPDGRIMESNAKGTGDKEAIVDFYTQSLTELGWQKDSNHNNKISARFVKNGERLDITITSIENDGNNINYHLSPAPK